MSQLESFAGKLAVVTGGGSGMGRELVRQLAAQGCSVAACDLNPDTVTVTAATAWAAAPPGVRVTGHACDVSDEAQVLRFRDELLEAHASDHVDLVFANAGMGGGESFVASSREVWERVFAVDWWGVYYCARVFLPLLIASGDGVRVQVAGRDRASLRRQLADQLAAHTGAAAGHHGELGGKRCVCRHAIRVSGRDSRRQGWNHPHRADPDQASSDQLRPGQYRGPAG